MDIRIYINTYIPVFTLFTVFICFCIIYVCYKINLIGNIEYDDDYYVYDIDNA